MRVTTKDPMTGNDVACCDKASFVVEGSGSDPLKIYFESELNKRAYLKILSRTPEACAIRLYEQIQDNETILWD